MPRAPPPGLARMRDLAHQFPQHLRTGFEGGLELGTRLPRVDRVHVVGIGGSAIGADLAKGLVDAETDLSLTISRGPDLPSGTGPSVLQVFVSYSGETWETVQAYESAKQRGGPRVVISSGGALTERALRDHVPQLPVPAGLPPRAAVGYLFGGLLGLLDRHFPESNEARLGRTVRALSQRMPSWSDPRGPAAAYARALDGRSVHILADATFAGLAHRWVTQIEENAKRVAHGALLPEFFHNGIEAWSAVAPANGRAAAFLTLEWAEASASTKWNFDYLDRTLRGRGVAVVRVPLSPSDRLEAVAEGVALGDQVSLFLAEGAGVDPEAIPAIIALKAARVRDGPVVSASSPRPRPKRSRDGSR